MNSLDRSVEGITCDESDTGTGTNGWMVWTLYQDDAGGHPCVTGAQVFAATWERAMAMFEKDGHFGLYTMVGRRYGLRTETKTVRLTARLDGEN